MSIWKRFSSLLAPSPNEDTRAHWVYIRCDHCGENIGARVDLFSDLSVEYGDKETRDTYYVRKTIIGSSDCYETIVVELYFDKNRKLTDKSIQNGEFVTEEEHLAGTKQDQVS